MDQSTLDMAEDGSDNTMTGDGASNKIPAATEFGFQETSLTEPLLAASESSEGEMNAEDVVFSRRTPEVITKQMDHEAWWTISLQVFIPYLIAGFGMVMAGLVLDDVQVSIIYSYTG